MENYRKQALAANKEDLAFAWVMDTLKDERKRGMSIDISLYMLETQKYRFTIIDTPGHRDFVKNTITGISQADAVVLVVDAGTPSITSQENDQIQELSLLTHAFGVDQIVVAVNKMDKVEYDERAFLDVKARITEVMTSIGIDSSIVVFVPVSGWVGDNLVKDLETTMSWYSGPSLLEAIESVATPERLSELPLRIPILDVYKVGGVGTVPVGRIASGSLEAGVKAIFAPGSATGKVKSLEVHHSEVEEATAGENVGFNVRKVNVKAVRRGFIASDADDRPARAVESFQARITLTSHPGKIHRGYMPILHIHTTNVACEFSRLIQKVDGKSGEPIEDSPTHMPPGDTCVVELKPTKPVCVEACADCPTLGRFVIRDMKKTVGYGIVLSTVPVTEEEESDSD